MRDTSVKCLNMLCKLTQVKRMEIEKKHLHLIYHETLFHLYSYFEKGCRKKDKSALDIMKKYSSQQ